MNAKCMYVPNAPHRDDGLNGTELNNECSVCLCVSAFEINWCRFRLSIRRVSRIIFSTFRRIIYLIFNNSFQHIPSDRSKHSNVAIARFLKDEKIFAIDAKIRAQKGKHRHANWKERERENNI